ncbi:MAG: right-handed parallel beta-helix repeat-containing protein [Chloroflexota bacterium]
MRRFLLAAVFVALALFIRPTGRSAATNASIYVGSPCGVVALTHYNTIHEAVSAAVSGDTIFVCPGTYVEPSIYMTTDNVTVFGPAATNDINGTATVQRMNPSANTAFFQLQGISQKVEGLDLDATPVVSDSQGTLGVNLVGSTGSEVAFNHIHNATFAAIIGSRVPTTATASVHDNTIDHSGAGIICGCLNGSIANNTIDQSLAMLGYAISLQGGSGTTVSGNSLAPGVIDIQADSSFVTQNIIDGNNGEEVPVTLAGDQVTFSKNQVHRTDTDAVLIRNAAFVEGITKTYVYFYNNTLDHVRVGVEMQDFTPGDSNTIDAVIGDNVASTNHFAHVIENDLALSGIPQDIHAEQNDWGFCSAADIEAKIYHHPDDASLGTVDFEPFIDPNPCPTATPTPSPSPTPHITPSPRPTPTPTGAPSSRKMGDLDCDGFVTGTDAFGPLDYLQALSFGQHLPCPNLGADVKLGSKDALWGDIDCSGNIDTNDTLDVLASLANLQYERAASCPRIGQTVNVTVP